MKKKGRKEGLEQGTRSFGNPSLIMYYEHLLFCLMFFGRYPLKTLKPFFMTVILNEVSIHKVFVRGVGNGAFFNSETKGHACKKKTKKNEGKA